MAFSRSSAGWRLRPVSATAAARSNATKTPCDENSHGPMAASDLTKKLFALGRRLSSIRQAVFFFAIAGEMAELMPLFPLHKRHNYPAATLRGCWFS